MIEDVKPVVKIFLAAPGGHGRPFCGPGMIRLLELLHKTGSVRHAFESMQMSYSKGWKLLSAMDAYLQYPVAERKQGGKGGGEAHLTEAGLAFLEKHRAFETECQKAVQKLFNKHSAAPTA
jgi:molybdate transport repressor ModE-like protein